MSPATPTTQRIITAAGKKIILVGTAHISATSAQEVSDAIRTQRPRCICVELDDRRFKVLHTHTRWQNLNIRQIIKRKEGPLLLASILLTNFQRRIAQSLDIEPGAEMKAATAAAREHDIPVVLCDRNIQTTLLRAWRLSSIWNKCQLFALLLSSMFEKRSVSAEEVERLKQENVLHSMLTEMARYLPLLQRVFIAERDRYLAAKIYGAFCDHGTAVAVIGAGHLPGVEEHLRALVADGGQPDLAALEAVPPPSRVGFVLRVGFSVLLGGLIISGFFFGGTEKGIQNITYWVLVNGIAAALGSIAALAHPLTIISSLLLAPLTSLNPTIGVGFVAALVESALRKPRAIDLQRVSADSQTLRGFYRNRFTKILLVFILSSIGSAIGTFVAFPLLF